MRLLSDPDFRYRITRIIHWVIAVVFFTLAFTTDALFNAVRNAAERVMVENLHVVVGELFALLLLVRVVWICFHFEERTHFDAKWQQWLAHTNYFCLYALMVLLPVTGLASIIAAGDDMTLLGVYRLQPVSWLTDVDAKFYAREAHWMLVYVSYAFLFLHVCGAISHWINPVIGFMMVARQERLAVKAMREARKDELLHPRQQDERDEPMASE